MLIFLHIECMYSGCWKIIFPVTIYFYIFFVVVVSQLLLCNPCRPRTHCLPQVGLNVITLLPRPLDHCCFYSMLNAIADIVVSSLPYYSLQCHDKILQRREIINSIFFICLEAGCCSISRDLWMHLVQSCSLSYMELFLHAHVAQERKRKDPLKPFVRTFHDLVFSFLFLRYRG